MEHWDIYDCCKQPTGRTMQRNKWTLKDGEYHLTVLGVIARPDGRFLITKRVMTKAWAPGWWEVSGGAAMAGEQSETAVRREIQEETGLDVINWDGGYLFSYKRENPGEGDNYFVDVYRYVGDFTDADLNLQLAETDGYLLATLDEIKGFAAQGIFLHYDSIKRAFELPLPVTGADRAVCRAIIRDAGEHLRNAADDYTITEKSGFNDLVTSCDRKIQEYLIEHLQSVCPCASFLCEEENIHEAVEYYQFVIDPIDGTANFINQYQHSGISVAFCTENDVLWGIVYNPFTDELYEAEQGQGAFLNGRQIHVHEKPLTQSLVQLGISPYRKDLKNQTMALSSRIVECCLDIRRSGSAALDLCYVAAGRSGVYYEMDLAPWDIAAGLCIAREAGAVVTDFNGKPCSMYTQCGVIAGNTIAHEECLSVVHEIIPDGIG